MIIACYISIYEDNIYSSMLQAQLTSGLFSGVFSGLGKLALGTGIFQGVAENFLDTGEIFGGVGKPLTNSDRFGRPAVFPGVEGQSDRLFRGNTRESRRSRLQCVFSFSVSFREQTTIE